MSSRLSPSPASASAHRLPARISWSPCPRLGALLGVGAGWLVAGLLWFPLALLAAVWWLGLLSALLGDRRRLQPAAEITARRAVNPVLGLGAAGVVEIALRSRTAPRYQCLLVDGPPLAFQVSPDPLAAELPSGGTAVVDYRVTPPRRGRFPFGPLHVRLRTPLALLQRDLRFDLTEEVKVYPRLPEQASRGLPLLQGREGRPGLHLARLRGSGLEFESLREYQPGDEPRRIDWKATARRGRPFSRVYEIERDQRLLVCLDLGRLMASQLGSLTKADHAVNAAALLAWAATSLGDHVGVYAFARSGVAYVPPRRHRYSQVLEALYGVQPVPVESDYQSAFLEVRHRLGKRTLVVLLTDLPDPDASRGLLRALRLLTGRHLVLCAALGDYELPALAARTPRTPREMYTRTVATALLADRRHALRAASAAGALTLDVTAADLSLRVLDEYLAIKAKGRL